MTDKAIYAVGDKLKWHFGEVAIVKIEVDLKNEVVYYVKSTDFGLGARVPESMLVKCQEAGIPKFLFKPQRPSLLVRDNFYDDPHAIRELALSQKFYANPKAYKGKRTHERFLFPGVKEEIERLLGCRITSWLKYGTNGIFQITGYNDPLVYHSDLQSFAMIIWMTPGASPSAGTSFWRDRKYGCLRPPGHPYERDRFQTDEERIQATNEIYSPYNLTHEDNWELVDKVGNVFNRAAIFDAKRIHSASSYEGFINDIDPGLESENSRLVQLFFFDVEN